MPKGSRRMAARQGALSKKRKQVGPRPTVIYQQPSVEVQAGGSDASTDLPLPEIRRPREMVAAPAAPSPSGPAVPAPSRRALPQNPYLKGDLRRIGVLTAVLLTVLIVLALILR